MFVNEVNDKKIIKIGDFGLSKASSGINKINILFKLIQWITNK